MIYVYDCHKQEDTETLAKSLSKISKPSDVWALFGTLGVGKSVLSRAFIKNLTETTEVPSPTFTLVQVYETENFDIYHYDLYRLKSPEEIWELNIEEAMYNGVCLIENKNAILVADDRTDIEQIDGAIFAYPPSTIKGLLEVRGVGIVNMPYLEKVQVKLAVNLVDNIEKIERMPKNKFYEFSQSKIPMIDIYPFEVSATDKIVIKLKGVLE